MIYNIDNKKFALIINGEKRESIPMNVSVGFWEELKDDGWQPVDLADPEWDLGLL